MKTATKEKPILFSGEMVRAILAGRKTVTRRLVKIPDWADGEPFKQDNALVTTCAGSSFVRVIKPRWKAGGKLWVRETWRLGSPYEDTKLSHFNDPEEILFDHVHYKADDWDAELEGQYRPSIFMPRWASRLTLEVVGVRVERLQELTGKEVALEGFPFSSDLDQFKQQFKQLWDKLNPVAKWDSNPWVWRVAFQPVTPA